MRAKHAISLLFGVCAALATTGLWSQGLELEEEMSLSGLVKPRNALKITISGELRLSLVARNDQFFRATLGDASTGGASLGGALGRNPGSSGTGSDLWMDPQVTLDLNFELRDGLSALVQLETPFYVFGDDAGGANNLETGTDRFVAVEQAYVRWERAFLDELTLQIGIQDFKKDWVGHGNPFFVDVHHSTNPFGNPLPGVDLGTTQGATSSFIGSQEAAGVWGQYEIGDGYLDAFYFTIRETFRSNADDALWGTSYEQPFEASDGLKGNVGAGIFVLQNSSSSYLWTFGLGGTLQLLDDALELYAEGYVQAGDYIARQPLIGGRSISQEEAWAIYGGMRYTLPMFEEQRPYVDFSYWELSGDDNALDSKNESFISLENNNDTLVVEDGWYGLDINTNYRKVAVKGGFNPTENITVEALYAYFELQDNNGTVDSRGAGFTRDKIGDEVDFRLRYRATDYMFFEAATGFLLNPKAFGLNGELNVTMVSAVVQF